MFNVLQPVTPQIQDTDDMENEIEELLQEFEDKSSKPFLHTVCFYWYTREISNKLRPNLQAMNQQLMDTRAHSTPQSATQCTHVCMHSHAHTLQNFGSGPQKWLLLDMCVMDFSSVYRGWTRCSAFIPPVQHQNNVLLHPSPVKSLNHVSSGRAITETHTHTHLVLHKLLIIIRNICCWCRFFSSST